MIKFGEKKSRKVFKIISNKENLDEYYKDIATNLVKLAYNQSLEEYQNESKHILVNKDLIGNRIKIKMPIHRENDEMYKYIFEISDKIRTKSNKIVFHIKYFKVTENKILKIKNEEDMIWR